MRKHYAVIRSIFKQYCTLESGADPFSMSWNAFTLLMTSIGVPDEQCKLDVRAPPVCCHPCGVRVRYESLCVCESV